MLSSPKASTKQVEDMGGKSAELLRLLIADQHRIVRAGVRALLMETRSFIGFEVEEAETTEEVFHLCSLQFFSVVMMDYFLPGRGGIKATEIVLSYNPATRVIILANSADGLQVDRILQAGALGCILRNVGVDTLIAAVRTVMSGKRFFSNEISQKMLDLKVSAVPESLQRLSARELEIFKHILEGYSDRKIGSLLGISKRTVDKHRQHINYKLGTKSPLELIQAGLRLGMVRTPSETK